MTNDIAIRPEGPAVVAVVEAWLEGTLPSQRAEQLRACVEQPGLWRDAYRSVVRELITEAMVPRLEPERSISVACSDLELEHAERIELLPLPHLGPQAHREGRLTARGTRWRVVGVNGAEAVPGEVDVPFGTGRLIWDDPVLGTLETPLNEYVPEPLQAAHDAFVSVSRLADGLEHPRARAVALAVAQELERGSLRDGLAAARDAFAHAKLDDDQERAWVVSALETQLALDRLAHRLCYEELDAQLLAADEALAPLGEALMLLDDRRYAALVHDHAVDEGSWWGFRARLDARVSDARLESGLENSRDELKQLEQEFQPEYADVVQLSDHRKTAEDAVAAAPRLRAVAAASEPGTVSILVALEAPGQPEHGQGQVLRATIKRGGSGDPFAQCAWFGALAKEAIRDAYQAVAAQCRDGVAPYPLEEHTIVLDDPDRIESVDGSSLGLAFALAFASLWVDIPLSGDLASTGRLARTRDGWSVQPVDHVLAKTVAARAALGAGVSVLAAAEHEADVRQGGLTPLLVGSVAEALRAAELDAHVHEVEGAWPDHRSQSRALQELIIATQEQDVARYGAFGNPWVVVARRMQTFANNLTGSRFKDLVEQAQPLIGLAYVHAGELRAAAQALDAITLDGKPIEVQLAAQTARLNATIDKADWGRCAELGRAIDGLLADIPEGEHVDLVGQALGTKGRAHLHARDFQAAEDLLTRAVQHHDRHRPEESGRSRVYLAQAQRNLGRPGVALATLETAQRDLEAHTRPDSGPYFQSCSMYLQHERARVLVVLDDADAALSSARKALESSRHLGFWPQLGILRTIAWAYRLLAKHDRADACVDEMKQLEVPQGQENLRDRLVDEAEGFPHPGGEVY